MLTPARRRSRSRRRRRRARARGGRSADRCSSSGTRRRADRGAIRPARIPAAASTAVRLGPLERLARAPRAVSTVGARRARAASSRWIVGDGDAPRLALLGGGGAERVVEAADRVEAEHPRARPACRAGSAACPGRRTCPRRRPSCRSCSRGRRRAPVGGDVDAVDPPAQLELAELERGARLRRLVGSSSRSETELEQLAGRAELGLGLGLARRGTTRPASAPARAPRGGPGWARPRRPTANSSSSSPKRSRQRPTSPGRGIESSPGGSRVEALERLVDDAAEPERVGGRVEPLRRQLVVDEPLVRAGDPALQRVGAEHAARPQLLEHARGAQRARQRVGVREPGERGEGAGGVVALDAEALQQLRAVGVPAGSREGPGEQPRGGRLVGLEHGPLRSADPRAGDRGPSPSAATRSQTSSTNGRARPRGAVLVAALPAQEQALGRARDAGVKEVALLVGLVGAAQVAVADRGAALLGEQRVGRRGARELAVLQAGAEQRPSSRRAGAVRAHDPHPALGRAAPARHRRRLQRLDRVGERAGSAPGSSPTPASSSSSSAAATPARSSRAENGARSPDCGALRARGASPRWAPSASSRAERARARRRSAGPAALAQADEMARGLLPAARSPR